MIANKIVNNILGKKPIKDCKSKNKTKKEDCEMCGKIVTQDKGEFVEKNGFEYFLCDECLNY